MNNECRTDELEEMNWILAHYCLYHPNNNETITSTYE